MFKVLGCVVHEHDLRLVAMSAVICILGCFTTTTLLATAGDAKLRHTRPWLVCAATVFGCSVWSLHFVAMLGFLPASEMAYDISLTILSIVVAAAGALAALFAWKAPVRRTSVSVVILIASLAAAMVKQHLSQRTLLELGRMRLLSNLAQEVLFIQRDGVVIEINNAGERLFKAAAGAIIGRPVLDLFASESVPALCRRAQSAPLGRLPEELRIKADDGSYVAVELSCHPIEYFGRPATATALRDLTDRKRDEARIRHLARHDALTNLPNRFNLQERLDIALDLAAQHGRALALVYIDLDRFKPVNDLFGHAVGDTLLIEAAKRILAEIHPTDMLARIGGDEFVMILTSPPQPERASLIGTRVIESMGKPFDIEGHRIEIGASVGVALYPEDGGDADTLMRAADAAMYRVKDEGRGALRFFESSMNAQLQAKLQLRQELAGAVERGELVLHYQPIVNGITGEVETFEALIRWIHPERGMVPPMDFIPLAEETGLIDGIGRWVIDTACREAAQWRHPWRVSVNVSPRQFRQTDICATLGRALDSNALHPARVVVEVTESILIEDTPKAVAILHRLKGMGVRVALDDFGTGYSSLSYLQFFKFDTFKIDKSFVKKLAEGGDALTIIGAIINLGQNLGLQVTVEGVETRAQLDTLRSLGCDQIQGYLIARPAPIDAYTDLDILRTMALFGRERQRLSA